MATFVHEGSDAKREVRLGASVAFLYLWAKHDGLDVEPSTTAADNQGTVYSPSDTELVVATNLTREQVGGAQGPWRLKQQIDASDVAKFTLGENYRWRVRWKAQGGTGEVIERQIFFDIVRTPLPILISDNDLKEISPLVGDVLLDLGLSNGQTFIAQAHGEMLDRIRAQGFRPSLVDDAERLSNPLKYLALHLIYLEAGRGGDDAATKRAEHYARRWNELWAGLGQLRYDVADSASAGPVTEFVQPRWTFHGDRPRPRYRSWGLP